MTTRWFVEGATNPSVLRMHVTDELTLRTIETCPPGVAPRPLDRLLQVPGVRSIDLHRYRARLNLAPGADPTRVRARVEASLALEWGPQADPPPVHAPRTFPVAYRGPRRAAESVEMARGQPLLAALLRVPGVAEAILEPRSALVRPAPLFSWAEVEPGVRVAIGPLEPRT